MKIRTFALASALLLFPVLASAVEVKNLYVSSIPVEEENKDSASLAQVLVKVTGDESIVQDPLVKKALQQPQQYLLQYKVERKDGESYYVARFDEQEIKRLLAQTERPVWGAQRPTLLTWIAIEEQGERILIDDQDEQWAESMKTDASNRGLPVMLPVMDLEDAQAVLPADVWGRFAEPIIVASERYGADHLILVRAYTKGGQFEAEWSLQGQNNGRAIEWESGTASGTPAQVTSEINQAVSFYLAQRFGIAATENALQVDLVVSGIESFEDFKKMQDLFRTTASISNAKVMLMQGDEIYLRLSLTSTEEAMENELGLLKQLEPLLSKDETLYFEWQGQ